MAEVISVSALNQYVKTLLDANDLLFDLALRGEIANFVQNARSGHCYFSLRDETSSVKAVMFRSDARRRKPGRPLGLQCRAHRAGRIPLQNTAHQRHRSRDRLYDPGLCGRPARPDPIGGGRARRARPGRIFTKIMQFGRKYSHFYPKQAEFML